MATAGIRLTPFTSCDQFLAYAKSQASAEVTPYGLASPSRWMGDRMAMMGPAYAPPLAAAAPGAASFGAEPSSAATSGGTSGGADGTSSLNAATTPAFSATNDQEAGVDEPDTVKTDGRVLVTLRNGGQTLQAVDVAGTPRLAGSLDLAGWASGLFLVGGEAVVIERGPSPGPVSPNVTLRATTRLIIVDVTNPDHLSVERSFTVEGDEVAARLIGRSIKLVVTSGPTLAFRPPADASPAASADALAANRDAIAGSTLGDWLPSVTDAAGVTRLAGCATVDHAAQPEGLDTVSVVTIDPDQTGSGDAVTVLADAQTVYASADNLYVASMSMPAVVNGVPSVPSPSAQRTVIHAFAIAGTGPARYLGSGEVPGTLLNQYSLSEYGGDLRVASTLGIPTPPPGEGGPVRPGTAAADQPGASESFVTVVRPEGGSLVTVGQVAGLGQGQKIFAVRFIGALGYVVTFRQLDPLYVVDLSDPRHPAVRGALELSGYSAYLHPLDGTHLLGVGGSADANGRRTGLQLTLFDVHDPSQPAKIAQASIPNGSSAAEQDPHAMLWWAPTDLAVIPVVSYDSPTGSEFAGAVGFRVGAGSGITEVGRISPAVPGATSPCPARAGTAGSSGASGVPAPVAPPCIQPGWSPIERDVVVGDRIFSFSPSGIVVSDLATLHPTASLAFS